MAYIFASMPGWSNRGQEAKQMMRGGTMTGAVAPRDEGRERLADDDLENVMDEVVANDDVEEGWAGDKGEVTGDGRR